MSSYVSNRKPKLVSMDTGKSTGYALMSVEERGRLFIAQGMSGGVRAVKCVFGLRTFEANVEILLF